MIAQVFQTIAIQNLPTSEASVILSTECIFAMLVSVIFTGETLTVPSLCGFALIFGAILLSEIQLPAKSHESSKSHERAHAGNEPVDDRKAD
ncbi:MAG: DMT family transporter [Bifidobacterium ruminantium]|uniref:DMT family transporter n=1 Tax=uncultured Bifidobacterium sp. TaxID=165187 RepID=UPI00258C7A60|nr:DMT family transporter [uncultured Bifidobacterium sp.]MEE0971418.1 DMT family transporter [Bifidobacterium ruminantium]